MQRAIVKAPALLCHVGRIVEIEPAGLVEGDLDDGSDSYDGYYTTPILDTEDAPGEPWIYGIECFSLLPPEEEVERYKSPPDQKCAKCGTAIPGSDLALISQAISGHKPACSYKCNKALGQVL